ncbi:MAG: GDSL-type esterase/lipase family protein [Verrucomicrobiota bacterium]
MFLRLLLPAIVVTAPVFALSPVQDSSTIPVPQRGMEPRHAQKAAAAKAHSYQVLLVGDSLTHELEKPQYKAVWEKFFGDRDALNLGYSGGRTENTIWNLQNGELENQKPKLITLLIGTNNSDDANYPVVHTPEQILKGTEGILKVIREKCPDTKVLLVRIFPRENVYQHRNGTERGSAAKRAQVNLEAGELIASLADNKTVFSIDANHVFLKPDGKLDPALVPDLLHPSPAGAEKWLGAIEPAVAKLLGEQPRVSPPANNAIVPVSKLENDSYDWWKRHAAILANPVTNPRIVLLGDSITHFWGGLPQSPGTPPRGPAAFEKTFGGQAVLNLGFGWDRTQNVLWRLDNGELNGLRPEFVVLNIGTNNFTGTKNARASTPEETAAGIREIILRVRAKSPASKIILMGVFPRGKSPAAPERAIISALNSLLAKEWTSVPGVTFLDIGAKFLASDGSISPAMMPDGLHPNEKAYAIWGEALAPLIR